ncbi:hypothetical protein Taro_048992 [Colocasia esculenta]|uniref:Uncharacterized protein n=1 Tax=Colocasia esculenta TaxID=4460 RepID=A0A843X9K6_COLES|nr:hypothetical protein [Colocasia esculenta]
MQTKTAKQRQQERDPKGRRVQIATQASVAFTTIRPEHLVAEELWNDHKKLIFFPIASAATCTDSHLEVNQRRRSCERDGPIGRVLWS